MSQNPLYRVLKRITNAMIISMMFQQQFQASCVNRDLVNSICGRPVMRLSQNDGTNCLGIFCSNMYD